MEIELKKKNIFLKANLLHVGDDLLICVTGGDKPHLGSSLIVNKNELKYISFKSHKDYIAFKIIGKILKKHTKKNICITGGIHIDNITKKQIKQILKLSKKLAHKIVSFYM